MKEQQLLLPAPTPNSGHMALYDKDKNILEWYDFPSQDELKREHDEGRCGAMCSYCWEEFEEACLRG